MIYGNITKSTYQNNLSASKSHLQGEHIQLLNEAKDEMITVVEAKDRQLSPSFICCPYSP